MARQIKSKPEPKQPSPCQCFAEFAYTITKGDTPESLQDGDNPDEVVAIVHQACGADTMHTFAPGHDAKLKGVLLRAARRGEDYAYVDGGMLIYANPQKELEKRGWLHLLVILKPRAKKERKAKATEATEYPEGKGDRALTAKAVEPEPDPFTAKVKIGRWTYPARIITHDGVGRVTVEYRKSGDRLVAGVVKPQQIVG